MEIFDIVLGKAVELSDSCACIGYFDGFHLGHQGLFTETLNVAKKKGLKSALITFDPDPWVTIRGASNVTHISLMQDREKWAKDLGFDYFLIFNFTKEMASLSPSDFVEKLIMANNIKELVCGYDFHFGDRGAGNPQLLRDNFPNLIVHEIEQISFDNEKISTTRINNLLESGDIELANKFLTRPYIMHGTVVHGQALGRKIGFPTANIKLLDYYVMPKNGVYIGRVTLKGNCYPAMINIGHNPTFNQQDEISIEAHIADFHEDIYGEVLDVELFKYLRDEKKFDSVELLVAELKRNLEETINYFK